MVNDQPHHPLAGSRPRATGVAASALLLVISVDCATAAGTVPPGSDLEDVSDDVAAGPGVLKFGGASEVREVVEGLLGEPEARWHFAVHRIEGARGPVSVSYSTTNGSATAGTDFRFAAGTLNWADGDTAVKDIGVTILDDRVTEGSEDFQIRLSDPTGGATIEPHTSIKRVRILDNEPGVSSLTLGKSTVAGCQSVTGKVQLANLAPAGGRVVSLSDTLISATTPVSVTVPGGRNSVTFKIKTTPVSTLESGTITANFGDTARSQSLSVRAMGMLSVALVPTTVAGTNPVAATARLECKAAPGPITVDLASSNAAIANPVAASIVVPQGLQSVPFDVATSKVLSRRSVSISGTANGIKKSRTLTVTPASFVSPSSLTFGTVPVGATGSPRAATLTNKGKTSFTVGSIGITGPNPLSFAMTENCPSILAAGASCRINVTFKPKAAKDLIARLSIATSARTVPLSVSLSGTGT